MLVIANINSQSKSPIKNDKYALLFNIDVPNSLLNEANTQTNKHLALSYRDGNYGKIRISCILVLRRNGSSFESLLGLGFICEHTCRTETSSAVYGKVQLLNVIKYWCVLCDYIYLNRNLSTLRKIKEYDISNRFTVG